MGFFFTCFHFHGVIVITIFFKEVIVMRYHGLHVMGIFVNGCHNKLFDVGANVLINYNLICVAVIDTIMPWSPFLGPNGNPEVGSSAINSEYVFAVIDRQRDNSSYLIIPKCGDPCM